MTKQACIDDDFRQYFVSVFGTDYLNSKAGRTMFVTSLDEMGRGNVVMLGFVSGFPFVRFLNPTENLKDSVSEMQEFGVITNNISNESRPSKRVSGRQSGRV